MIQIPWRDGIFVLVVLEFLGRIEPPHAHPQHPWSGHLRATSVGHLGAKTLQQKAIARAEKWLCLARFLTS